MKIIINELKNKGFLSQGLKGKIKKVTKLVLSRKNIKGAVSITFVDDPFIRKLNKKHRKMDRATDVLSFSMNEEGLIGDIVISLDSAKRNAKRYNEELNKEILRLVVHGSLHLMDFDHVKKSERQHFFKKQDSVLKQI